MTAIFGLATATLGLPTPLILPILTNNDNSRGGCKDWFLGHVQDLCSNNQFRRQTDNDHEQRAARPNHQIMFDETLNPKPEPLLNIPERWSDESEMPVLERIRRLDEWQIYEECCRDYSRTQRRCFKPRPCYLTYND